MKFYFLYTVCFSEFSVSAKSLFFIFFPKEVNWLHSLLYLNYRLLAASLLFNSN